MSTFRPAKLQDIMQIQKIEKEYYEGLSCPKEILKSWIEKLPKNFIVAEENGRIAAFIFFERLNKIKAMPFVHNVAHSPKGEYVYISEIGISGKSKDCGLLQELLEKAIEKSKRDKCKAIIWVTGSKSKHDKIEMSILRNNGFVKKENAKRWEAYPGHFVGDHHIWIKKL
jgi:N-acetylglutamate synthase-like GNAT family acetyltransferase